MSLLVASINIERDKHIDTVCAFLAHEKPEVVCMQEVFEEHVEQFKAAGDFTETHFSPRSLYNEAGLHTQGLLIMSRLGSKDTHTYVHRGDIHELQVFDESSLEAVQRTHHLVSQFVTVEKEGRVYRIGNTHFTWTPDGGTDDYQRRDLKKLLHDIAHEEDCALLGDFNAPRGGEIFTELTRHFTDNVPPEYKSSIDIALHRNGRTAASELSVKMVDGFFTRGSVMAESVRLMSGISDHMALLGHIS